MPALFAQALPGLYGGGPGVNVSLCFLRAARKPPATYLFDREPLNETRCNSL